MNKELTLEIIEKALLQIYEDTYTYTKPPLILSPQQKDYLMQWDWFRENYKEIKK